MRRLLVCGIVALCGAVGVAFGPALAQPRCAPGVIFVANGSGDATDLSENLGWVLSNTCLPFRMQTVRWSKLCGTLADHNDVALHHHYGAVMAAQVEAIRKRCPGTRICLMGHSSGTHVVLAAAESLPPGSIDRIVLLSPSVSSTYDLRRALKATCTGIDVYYSPDDGVLFVAIPNYGTADGLCGVPAAGQVGFCRPPASLPDSQLYGLVHQYRFDDNLYAGTGNHGGHHGPCRERFLRLVVLPNIMGQSLWANCPPRP